MVRQSRHKTGHPKEFGPSHVASHHVSPHSLVIHHGAGRPVVGRPEPLGQAPFATQAASSSSAE
jgi:hypothetical protein